VSGGLCEKSGLSLLALDRGKGSPAELLVRSYGSGQRLAERLIERIRAWQEAGRPSLDQLRVSAYSASQPPPPDSGPLCRRAHTTFVFHWPKL
jgi:hypothetical protein